jgi:hypothetical protein
MIRKWTKIEFFDASLALPRVQQSWNRYKEQILPKPETQHDIHETNCPLSQL